MSHRPPLLAGSALLVLLVAGQKAQAEPLRVHAIGAAERAISGTQADELGWGGTARLGFEWLGWEKLGLLGRVSGTFLSKGAAPKDPDLRPLEGARGFGLGVGVAVHPLATAHTLELFDPSGLWLTGTFGAMVTGGLMRPTFDAGLGYDLYLWDGQLGMGPAVGYEQVLQSDSELRPDDAHAAFFGVHAMLEFGRAKPPASRVDGDRDRDKIPDSVDACPDVPEDRDGFRDEDGCPEFDNDADGIPDVSDGCPNVPEDRDGYEDQDGCPDADNDQDGLLDRVDRCPNEPEDRDGYEDQDGCPDVDNDQDGIVDGKDLCPNEPETKNGYADEDGCPDAEQVRVIGDRIILDDRVNFMINSHIIRSTSFALLKRVAGLIADHPEYVHVEVQGHTDERGPDWYNVQLGERRAKSVMEFLVSQGVEASRLTSRGYANQRPLLAKQTEYAHYMNRRVEFEITRSGESDATQAGAMQAGATPVDKTPTDKTSSSAPGTPVAPPRPAVPPPFPVKEAP